MAVSATRTEVPGVASSIVSNETRCWAARLARALAWTSRWNRTLTEMNGGGWIELALPIKAAASPPGRSRVNRVMPPSLLARSTGSPSSFL